MDRQRSTIDTAAATVIALSQKDNTVYPALPHMEDGT
jgi:hypothetical protein